jgi:hypothetical protein
VIIALMRGIMIGILVIIIYLIPFFLIGYCVLSFVSYHIIIHYNIQNFYYKLCV